MFSNNLTIVHFAIKPNPAFLTPRLILKQKFKLRFNLRHKAAVVSWLPSSRVRSSCAKPLTTLPLVRYVVTINVYVTLSFCIFGVGVNSYICNWLNVMRFDVSQQETVKTEEDRIKLFLLHIVLLNKLPLKYRAQAINSTLLVKFYKAKGGTGYPFHEVSEHKRFVSIIKAAIHD